MPDEKVGRSGRTVKCAACGNRWTAAPELVLGRRGGDDSGDIDFVPLSQLRAATEEQETEPVHDLPGEALPKMFRARAHAKAEVRQAMTAGVIWAGMVALLGVIIALAIVYRLEVVKLWPRSASAYALVGLPVNPTGLVIESVKAAPTLRAGHAALTVYGVVRNVRDRAVQVPPVQITLFNPKGKRVAGQIAVAEPQMLPPGAIRHFSATLLDPPATASDLEVAFALKPGVMAKVRSTVPLRADKTPLAASHIQLRGPADHDPLPTEAVALPDAAGETKSVPASGHHD